MFLVRRSLALAAIAMSVVASAQTRLNTTVDVAGMEPLPVLSHSQRLGAANPDQVLHLAISLAPRDLAGLENYANLVSNPRSLMYGQFLSPAQVGARFGATWTTQSSMAQYLTDHGLKVTLMAPNRMAILADGTIKQVQAALGTTISNFSGPAAEGGSTVQFYANSAPPKLPRSVASQVVDIEGLESYTRPMPRATTTTLTPPTTRGLYKTAPTVFGAGFNGQGRTIGISNWDGYSVGNASLYITKYSLPIPAGGATSNISSVKVDGGAPNRAQGEGDLDLQMVLGMAPLASIIMYDGGAGLVTVLTREATDNAAQIISESWGWNLPAATATAAHNQHLSMTAQGITYMAASGDSGTTLEPYSYPNYEPEVLMVGGTRATVDTVTGARSSETGWSGSGGGWSTNTASFNVRPSWQVGTGVPTNINKRLCPDLALHASGISAGAYSFYYRNKLTSGYIGTSFACPIFAGCLGVAEQKLVGLGKLPSGRFGRIQDLVYGQNGNSSIWFDITSGSNGNLPNGSASSCTAKWDFVTGWGAIDFNAFVNSIP